MGSATSVLGYPEAAPVGSGGAGRLLGLAPACHSPGASARPRPLVLRVPPELELGLKDGAKEGLKIGLRGRELTIQKINGKNSGDNKKLYIDADSVKLGWEHQVEGLQWKIQQLEKENFRLRRELQEIQGTFAKVKQERDSAKGEAMRTQERFLSSGKALDRIQKQFELYQENKEQELQNLHKALKECQCKEEGQNSRLSSTKHRLIQDRRSSGCISPVPYIVPYVQNNEDEAEVEIPSHLFLSHNHYFEEQKDICIHHCYVALGKEMEPYLHCFKQQYEDELHLRIQTEEISFSLASSLEFEGLGEKWKKYTESKSSIFVSILNQINPDPQTIEEMKDAVQKLSTKSALVTILVHTDDSTSEESADRKTLNDLIGILTENSSRGAYVKILNKCNETKAVAQTLLAELSHILLRRGKPQEISSVEELCSYKRYCCGNAPSQYMTGSQMVLKNFFLHLGKGVCLTKYLQKVEAYLHQPGEVGPFVVSGSPGMGATSFLLHLIDFIKTEYCPPPILLTHFTLSSSSRLSQPHSVIFHLTQQLLQYIPETMVDSTTLFENFYATLKKIAELHPTGIVLIVDAIDRISQFESQLPFVLHHPLPKNLRVVVSLHEENCPESWLSWPCVHLEPPTYQNLHLLVQQKCRSRGLSLEKSLETKFLLKCHSGARCCPLYVSLLVSAVKFFSMKNEFSKDEFSNGEEEEENVGHLFPKLLLCSDVGTLYEAILCRLQSQFPRTEEMLRLVCTAREGLLRGELFSLLQVDGWEELLPTIHALTQTLVLAEEEDFLWIPFADAKKVAKKFCFSSKSGQLATAKYSLNSHFEDMFKTGRISVRLVDEFPHLTRGSDGQFMEKFLSHPLIFSLFYTRGRAWELRHLWYSMGKSSLEIASRYLKSFDSHFNDSKTRGNQCKILNVGLLYGSLGRFLQDEGMEQEALFAYQKAVSLCEREGDPDHPAVGLFLHFLSDLHEQWDKPTLAIVFLKQSMEIYSAHFEPTHPLMRRILQSLAALYKKEGKLKLAQQVMERLNQLQVAAQHKEAETGQMAILKRSEATYGESHPLAMSTRMNLAVLYSKQNRFFEAEALYEQSVELCKKTYGEDHVSVARVLKNFALFKKEQGDYVTATKMYQTAQDIFQKTSCPATKPISKSARSVRKTPKPKTPRLSAKSSPPIFQ